MWALRRVPNPLKGGRISIEASYAATVKLQILSNHIEEKAVILGSSQSNSDRRLSLLRFYHSTHASSNLYVGRRGLSSQAGAENSSEEDDLEDGFSELEAPSHDEKNQNVHETEDGSISDPELSGDEGDIETLPNELEFSETETDPIVKKRPSFRKATSPLFQAISSAPALYVNKALDQWLEEGKEFSRSEISLAMVMLRKRKMFARALQFSEWLEANKQLEFTERDYASRIDLIAKVRGLQKAEYYIQQIPLSFRNEVIYRTLLANCVSMNNPKKAEEVFNKMKDLEFPISSFSCNQLLLLYKRLDKKKIADVLLLMEKENVKPSAFTYRILIDAKGLSNDISGMDEIVRTMKDEGIEPDLPTQATLARHYVSGGLPEKAEAILKEMEGENLIKNRWPCQYLLPLYAELGKAEEVARIWNVCKSSPSHEESKAAIQAWGKLNKVEDAERVFYEMLKKSKKLGARYYSPLMKVYTDHKMLQKGKDLVKLMADNGCQIGPLTWDALVKLYVEAGELEKADAVLQKACRQNVRDKPMFNSFISIMEQYSKKGDVHNSEKLFHRMKEAGYVSRIRQYQCLVQAYVNARTPAYGMRDRLKADSIFPSKSLAAQLVKVDPFRKTSVSDLLD